MSKMKNVKYGHINFGPYLFRTVLPNYIIKRLLKDGDDFTINQQTGTITGDAFDKSIQATLTTLIIALGG